MMCVNRLGQIEKRQNLGQILTPEPVAELMASFFTDKWENLELLDAGAGEGSLTLALIKRLCNETHKPKKINVTAYEIDDDLIDSLEATLLDCEKYCKKAGIRFSFSIINEDFIESAVVALNQPNLVFPLSKYNAAIVNPPYKKIRSDSSARNLLRMVGIEVSNIYAGFVALIIKLLAEKAELVAITPRSFCNGPYFKPFRFELLDTMAIRRLHVFESRSSAFRKDDVLQENIIFHAIKSKYKPKYITISSSSGEPNDPIIEHSVRYDDVVLPKDSDKFIHLMLKETQIIAKSKIFNLSSTLNDLGINVSTGRVVDFRAKTYLRQEPEKETVPLIYPNHFNGWYINWPKQKIRKPNAIIFNEHTRDLLVPKGIYVLVKRFSSKEEKRRIVACIYDSDLIDAQWVGFENHLNYYHMHNHGLDRNLARGLAAFLNSSIVDEYFRQFSGHTQVNVTDLQSLKYPSKIELELLGRKALGLVITQAKLDEFVENIISKK